MRLHEIEVIDLDQKRKERQGNKTKKVLHNIADQVPDAIQNQDRIESIIEAEIEKIKKTGSISKLNIASPSLMANYRKDLLKLEYLKLHLPFLSSVDNSYENKKLISTYERETNPLTALAIEIVYRNLDEIFAAMDEDAEKTSVLIDLAKDSPAPQYSMQPITRFLSQLNSYRMFFDHMKRYKDRWEYYLNLIKNK